MEVGKRIFGLDVMRALAIFFVMLAHTYEFVLPELEINLNRLFGFLGVEIFFVLSGFLIGRILIKSFQKENFGMAEIKHFWIRRWFRTLPNYYLCLGLYFLFHYLMAIPTQLSTGEGTSYFFFLQNAIHPHPGFFAIAWSLSIEEWFYLSFPVILYIIALLFKNKRTSIIIAVATYLIACLLLRSGLSIMADLNWGSWFRKMIFWRLDAIALGVGVAYVYIYHENILRRQQVKFALAGGLGLTVLLIPFWNIYVISGGSTLFLDSIFFTLVSLCCAGFLPYLSFWKSTRFQKLGNVITFLSLISYSLYLLHWMVVLFFYQYTDVLGGWTIFGLVWFTSLFTSWVVYKYFEIPMTKLRDRY